MNQTTPVPLLSETNLPGTCGIVLPESDVPPVDPAEVLGSEAASAPPNLPELPEREVTRHFTSLACRMMSVDRNFYPLGSCTMKYNPKFNEWAASLPGFTDLHPYQPADDVQGAMELLYRLRGYLEQIAGLAEVSLHPAAGAQGEFTSVLVVSAYFADRGEDRPQVLIPDSAHGTNPASCALSGKYVTVIKSTAAGLIDLDALKANVSDKTALMMITNPNTLGLFERDIAEIARILHDRGAQLYLDGANMNAILGRIQPGQFGVDVMHYNTHKTFSTPHGCGGPGAGPIAVAEHLRPFLPVPQVERRDGRYVWDYDRPKSIGRVRSFYNQFLVMVRAYAYIRSLGLPGLRRVSEEAVVAANYLATRLRDHYNLPYPLPCMHEFVLSAEHIKEQHGVRALDVAKRLIDFGIHPPTVYFPITVPECIMVEPTESETTETLDRFVDVMAQIAEEAKTDPDKLHKAPWTTPVRRVDEVQAARKPKLHW
ncbi:MAG: aminomethyl-transferring glycine dehydrogenase subunit GcvPB [Phycisphaerae bacterium]|nr:aminomethyl-transferring glycine dehydrogenase subunit GcvPB [Phycisphaerae bacterium]